MNADDRLILDGSVSTLNDHTYGLDAKWILLNNAIELTEWTSRAYTPVSNKYSITDLATDVLFPLSIQRNTFDAGDQLTLQLVAAKENTGYQTFKAISSLTIMVNMPPKGGSTISQPTAGFISNDRFRLYEHGPQLMCCQQSSVPACNHRTTA